MPAPQVHSCACVGVEDSIRLGKSSPPAAVDPSAATKGGAPLSALGRRLLVLAGDGYLEAGIALGPLEEAFLDYFSEEDLELVTGDGGPFAPLFRRFAHDPAYIRK